MDKIILSMDAKHSTYEIYLDFIEAYALSIRNAAELQGRKKRDQRVKEIQKKYKEEVYKFGELGAQLVIELEREERDVLGDLFMRLGLGAKLKGQFFTPDNISRMLAEFQMESIEKELQHKRYIAVSDDACGGGSTLIGLAHQARSRGINYQKQILMHGTDLDIKAVYMTYIQLSLLGIPAIIKHGNSLTLEMFDTWYTPSYIVQMHKFRRGNNGKCNRTETL